MKKLLLIALLASVSGAFAGCGCGCEKKPCCKEKKECCKKECCPEAPCCEKEVVVTKKAKAVCHHECPTYSCPAGYHEVAKK